MQLEGAALSMKFMRCLRLVRSLVNGKLVPTNSLTVTVCGAGLTPKAMQAQEQLMKLPGRFRAIDERRSVKKANKAKKPVEFSWLFNRTVPV